MNLDENIENSEDKEEEITVKIRAMDKEFEIKIKKSLTIKALKEKISEVNNNYIIYFQLYRYIKSLWKNKD